MKRARRWIRSPAAVGALLTCVCVLLCALHRTGREVRFLETLERATLDQRFQWRGVRPPGDEVVIVALDDATVQRDPELIEKRRGAARVIAAVAALGPAAIGVDGFYSDAEEVLSPQLVADIDAYMSARTGQDGPAEALLRRTGAETHGDDVLARAIAAAGNVVLAMHLERGRSKLPPDPALAEGTYGQVVVGGRAPPAVDGGVVSLPMFNRAARALGVVTVYEDEDHTVREMLFARRVGDSVFMPLVVPLLALHQGVGRGELAYVADGPRVQVGPLRVPLTGQDSLLLNFRGPAGTFATVSAIDVVEGKVAAERLRGKIALVGVTYFGHDTTRTPFGGGVPGVELHATAIDTILAGDAITRVSALHEALACLLSGLLVVLLFAGRLGPIARVGGILLVVAADLGAAWLMFTRWHLWHGMVWPALTTLVVAATLLAMAYVGEAVQRVRLRRSFAHYVGADVLEEMLADPHLLNLGGARRELTVLFSDIRDFTALSERLTPEELVQLLNVYLTPMTQAVLLRGGYLDKYIGDAVMAVYGAPVPKQNHAGLALATAVGMCSALAKLQPQLEPRGITLRIGVGVNTGDMVVGNMGSSERFDYTVVGDAVNLASRLEGLTKVYGVFCLVGPLTRAQAPAGYRFRELDLVRVKGKGQPVAIFELLCGPDEAVVTRAALDRWEAGVAAYRRGAFAAAREELAAFAAENPDDPVVRLYQERLAGLGEAAPPGWEPVVNFHNKG
ncbi:MAG: CHASE2 domain-containing protein [Myxococcales bacterium]|nr:CHASE2 domain-containing protein [Myxococcales bacterium]